MAENIAEVLVAVQADVKNAVTEITNLKKDLTDTVKAGKSFDSFFEKLDKTLAKFNIITEGSTAELSDLIKGLTSATTAVNNLTGKLGELATKGGKNIATLANSSNNLEKSIRDAAAQANRFNTGNILAQIQDIGVTAAMNMNPMTIALQQGTQLLYVFQQSKAPIAEFVAALKSMFSPLSLLTIGLTGLVAAGIQMVDWTATAQGALNGLAKAFEWVAENSGIVAAGIGLITLELGAHIIKVVAWKEAWNAAVKFLKSIQWSKLLDGLIKFGKMLISPWILIPAVIMGAIEAFALFPNAIKKALNVAIDFITEWVNKTIGLFNAIIDVAKNVPVAIKDALSGKKIGSIISDFNKIISDDINKNYINSEKIKNVADGAVDAVSNGVKKINDVVSNSVKSMSETASKSLKSMAKGLGENTKEADKLEKAIKKVDEAYENAIFSNQVKISDLKFTESTRGMTDEQKIVAQVNREYKKQLNNLERKAKAENLELKLFDEYKKKLEKQKEEETNIRLEIYENEQAQKAWNSAMDYSASVTKGFFSDLKSGLQEGQSAWEAFTNAVLKMLDKIADKMMDMAVDSMFDSFKQGQTKSNSWMSTAVSAIASVFTGGSAGPTNLVPEVAAGSGNVDFAPDPFMYSYHAKGGAFTNGVYKSPTMFAYANGGKFGVMGEAGPEAVIPLHRSPDGSLGVRADGMGGSSPVVVNVINNSNARATTQQRQTEQGTTIDVMIDELVAHKLGQQGTASNQALTAFNNRQLVAR